MNNHSKGISRRDFLVRTAKFAAATTVFMGLGNSKLFGAILFNPAKNSVPTVTLNNGIPMPILGFGTNTLIGEAGARHVEEAISVGYRLIDTAKIYGNEEAVGIGIINSGINREELFVTSKLWVYDTGYENTKRAFQISLDKLGLEYLDLYLLHRPRGDVKGSWKAMEELCKEGKIKSIGISNFSPSQLAELLGYAKIKPVINQIESHVFFHEKEQYPVLKRSEVQMEAWSPFAAGRNGIFENPTIAVIGKKYGKSNAQVCLRWHYQRSVVAIPRSSQKAHMIENLDIFDFELANSDMETIASLDLNITQFPEWK